MVKYWKTGDSVEAKVYQAPEGHYVMQMRGEKYPFPGYPRGTLLFGALSPLKHEIKNQIFNDCWAMLEKDMSKQEILLHMKQKVLPNIFALAEKNRFDMVPFDKMVPPVKEIWRAMTVIEEQTGSKAVQKLKEIMCFILQEDDAYRFRLQWIIKFFNPSSWWMKLLGKSPIESFYKSLQMLEYAEVVGDMKERIRLLRRILIFLILNDEKVGKYFNMLAKEMDWSKLKLTKADKYFFRAKYFKVDYPEYQY